MMTTAQMEAPDLTGKLIEQSSTLALGWILAQHCELRWTADLLDVRYCGTHQLARDLLHEDETLRVLRAFVTKITGRDYAVRVIDGPRTAAVHPRPVLPVVPIAKAPEPTPEPRTPTYRDLWRDPRWQRKRLEVMQREDFRCQTCGAQDVTLNVHHGYYEKGLKPWEYHDDSLHCLCEPCHEKVQELLTEIHRRIGYIRTMDGLEEAYGYVYHASLPEERRHIDYVWTPRDGRRDP